MKRALQLFIAGGLMVALAGCGTTDPTTSNQVSSEGQVSNTSVNIPTFHTSNVTSNATNSADNTAQNSTSNPDNSSSSTNSTSDISTPKNYIPGLNLEDIRLNLQNTWKLKFKMDASGHPAVYNGTAVDPDTGATLTCSIYFDSVTQVLEAVFTVNGSAVMSQEPASYISQVASGYLGFSATVPYTGAQPAAAKAWIQSHVTAQSGESTKNFGQVQYRLTTTKWVKTLMISSKDFTG